MTTGNDSTTGKIFTHAKSELKVKKWHAYLAFAMLLLLFSDNLLPALLSRVGVGTKTETAIEVDNKIYRHNTSDASHLDIRKEIAEDRKDIDANTEANKVIYKMLLQTQTQILGELRRMNDKP